MLTFHEKVANLAEVADSIPVVRSLKSGEMFCVTSSNSTPGRLFRQNFAMNNHKISSHTNWKTTQVSNRCKKVVVNTIYLAHKKCYVTSAFLQHPFIYYSVHVANAYNIHTLYY